MDSYTVEEAIQLLKGSWRETNAEDEYYLSFGSKEGQNYFEDNYRKGEYTIEPDGNGKFTLSSPIARHARTLEILDKNAILLSYSYRGKTLRQTYEREHPIVSLEEVKKLLPGRWNEISSKGKHFLLFYREEEKDCFMSGHRHGTYSLDKNKDHEVVLTLSSAHHHRHVEVLDKDTIVLTYTHEGELKKRTYRRDTSLLGKLKTVLKKH